MPKGRPTDPTVKRAMTGYYVAKRLHDHAKRLDDVGATLAAKDLRSLADGLNKRVLED